MTYYYSNICRVNNICGISTPTYRFRVRKVYRGKDIEVSFDLDICIHVGECLRGQAQVFDLKPMSSPGRVASREVWPELPYSSWKDTLATLHMNLQIVGR